MTLLSTRRSALLVGPQGVPGPQGPPGQTAAPLTGSASWTPGTITNGSTVSTTVAVSGAAVGMTCTCAFNQSHSAEVLFVCKVTAPSVVTVTFINLTGGSVTIGAGVVKAVVTVS